MIATAELGDCTISVTTQDHEPDRYLVSVVGLDGVANPRSGSYSYDQIVSLSCARGAIVLGCHILRLAASIRRKADRAWRKAAA